MAENKNRSDADYWEEESPYDVGPVYKERKEEAQIPPRNILETDSAKHTTEFVKGIVKGLYTATPGFYSEPSEPDYEPRNRIEYADEPPPREYTKEPALERRPEPTPGRSVRREVAEPPSRSEERWERPATGKEPPLDMPRREPHQDISRREPVYDMPRKETPQNTPRREPVYDMPGEEVLTADGFLKAYEEKNRQERTPFAKKANRRTFSSLDSGENSQELESILSGKPAKRAASAEISSSRTDSADNDEEFAYIKSETLREYAHPRDYESASDSETVYRKVSQSNAEIEERDGYISVPAYEEIPVKQERTAIKANRRPPAPTYGESSEKQEKIPIIINKRIEGKPKKTADDYRNINRSEYEKPTKRFDNPSPPRGANVFAIVFMAAAILIIGFLVWKIASTPEASPANADEIAGLREQNRLLAQRNSELEERNSELAGENQQLLEEVSLLQQQVLASDSEGSEEENGETTEESPPVSANGLSADGYYTVQRGDTLWKISEKLLGNGDQYLKIATLNNLDPNEPLFVGSKLKIPTQ